MFPSRSVVHVVPTFLLPEPAGPVPGGWCCWAATAACSSGRVAAAKLCPHKCKGLEWVTVRIADDFRQPRDPEGGELLPIPKDMAMLGYVAVTQGREVLDSGGLAWARGHLDALGQSASGCAVVAATLPSEPGPEA